MVVFSGKRRGEIEPDIGEELSLNTSLGFDQYNKVKVYLSCSAATLLQGYALVCPFLNTLYKSSIIGNNQIGRGH